jgi:CMP-N-acetylneuraminic acid synthetase
MKNKKFIALIPARGGSKKIKNKNIKFFLGKPLVFWTIEAAIKSKMFSKIYLSTDSIKMINLVKKFKEIKILKRSKILSGDNVVMFDVIKNFYESLDLKNFEFKGLVLLQPTSPLRTKEDIVKSCKLFNKYNPDSLVSVCELNHQFHPDNIFKKNKDKLKRIKAKKNSLRQNKPKLYSGNGSAIYITHKKNISKFIIGGNIIGYEMPENRSIDIDRDYDFKLAELVKVNELY